MMRPTARLIEEKKPSEATHQRSPAESRRRSPPKPVPVRSQLAGDRLSGSSVFGHRAGEAPITVIIGGRALLMLIAARFSGSLLKKISRQLAPAVKG